MLILHIGLPKTATTFLQYRIFPKAAGLRFLHRSVKPAGPQLSEDFRTFAAAPSPEAAESRIRICRRLARYRAKMEEPDRPLLLSDENISIHWSGLWEGAGHEPDHLADRFNTLRRDLADLFPDFRVLIGIRRQDQWLGSRYAESAKNHPDFCQTDFDERMAAIAAGEPLRGALAWLDYAAVHGAFTEALGRENVFLAPAERLKDEAHVILSEMGQFTGADLLAAHEAMPEEDRRKRPNRLSKGENSWRLRRDGGGLIRLSPALEDDLRARFARSNRALATAGVPLGFES